MVRKDWYSWAEAYSYASQSRCCWVLSLLLRVTSCHAAKKSFAPQKNLRRVNHRGAHAE